MKQIKSEDQAIYNINTGCSLTKEQLEEARKYFLGEIKKGESFTNSNKTEEYISLQLAKKDKEEFWIMYLDNKHQLISFEKLFSGTVDSCAVHSREVLKDVLKHNACALILAHNHPSGSIKPSFADQSITSKIKSALELIDVRLLDHIIIGNGSTTSMARVGML